MPVPGLSLLGLNRIRGFVSILRYINPTIFIIKLSSIELLSQCLWGNEYFKVKGKTLPFKNWVKSGFIYVKDLFDSNGSWQTEKEITNKLLVKCNWMTELLLIKYALRKFLKDKDVSACRYIQQTLLERSTLLQGLKFITLILNLLTPNYSTLYYEIKNLKNHMQKKYGKNVSILVSVILIGRLYTLLTLRNLSTENFKNSNTRYYTIFSLVVN